ncbi:MAG: hypothetical protein AVDCRST_MAG10-2075, partial [uncultured Acidimicrobiales bacterium]
ERSGGAGRGRPGPGRRPGPRRVPHHRAARPAPEPQGADRAGGGADGREPGPADPGGPARLRRGDRTPGPPVQPGQAGRGAVLHPAPGRAAAGRPPVSASARGQGFPFALGPHHLHLL